MTYPEVIPLGDDVVAALKDQIANWWQPPSHGPEVETTRGQLIAALIDPSSTPVELQAVWMDHQDALEALVTQLNGEDQRSCGVWINLDKAMVWHQAGYRHEALLGLLDCAEQLTGGQITDLAEYVQTALTAQFDHPALKLENASRRAEDYGDIPNYLPVAQAYGRLSRKISPLDSRWRGRIALGRACALREVLRWGKGTRSLRESIKWESVYAERDLRDTPEHIEAIRLMQNLRLEGIIH